MRVRWQAIVLFLFLVLSASGQEAPTRKAFYATDNLDLSKYADGEVIRSEPMPGAPDGASAFRVLYRSQNFNDAPVAVSGVVIIPKGTPPAGGRPIVAWAHPTTGIVSQCAPSLARVFFASVQGLHEMLQHGWIITATDYPGLGTPGPHPYLVGNSEGHAVLDSVRAAANLPGANATKDKKFAVWGHSQGGQAALFAGILAAGYASDLKLVGVAAAAPATNLAALLNQDIDSSRGRNITAMTLWSWSQIYNAKMSTVVTPEAIPVIEKLANDCIERFFDVLERRGPTKALERSFLTVDNFYDAEPWHTLLTANSAGPPPPDIPIFLAQGTKDNLVRPKITESYLTILCKGGAAVEYDELPNVGHLFAARDSAKSAISWMGDRFAGKTPPSNCKDHMD